MTIFKNLVHKNVCRTAQFWPQPRTLSLDTVGDVMAPSPLTIAPSMKVYEAVERVRQVGFSSPQMNTCYVVDENGLLLGLVTVRDLILARGGQLIQSVMKLPVSPWRLGIARRPLLNLWSSLTCWSYRL